MHWAYLSMAIIAEVAGSAALKQSAGFSKPGFAATSVICFGVALFFLSLALRTMPLGIAYAIWAGAGVVLVSLLGALVFRQSLDAAALAGIGLIVCGVVVINTLSNSINH
ncbi:multidrug efflux SMR transporter [Thalassococcus sp. S3]|uniref:DMT family transporter n=1 Tax=Thalassococcus sp. S3 TaxID=2017482 RepID=UPI00102434F5|nr:multidrug efflux SMR transporter [Thalassococcus sp. S3]QBF33386.1 QacE family quaternary ammonium compound efflux SMR transporter [Thalassococcus sp. S3]